MTPSLAISEGWKLMGPIFIQRWAPVVARPKPKGMTRISSTMAAPSTKTDIQRKVW